MASGTGKLTKRADIFRPFFSLHSGRDVILLCNLLAHYYLAPLYGSLTGDEIT